ncbi:MAG: hypothetical protein ACYCOU_15000 [Sulfobacillus sp.]
MHSDSKPTQPKAGSSATTTTLAPAAPVSTAAVTGAKESKETKITPSVQQHSAKRQRTEAAQLPRSGLSFDDVRDLSHVVVAHFIAEEPEIVLWHATVTAVHADARTVDVVLREWRLPLEGLSPDLIFKPSASLPAV